MENEKNYFDLTSKIDFDGKIKEKNNLSYLPWARAWGEAKRIDPHAQFYVHRFGEAQLPYTKDDRLGYIVYVSVTMFGKEHMAWLPVLDGANMPMKDEPYKYTSGYGERAKEKTVDAISLTDINKAIMRCLTKGLAMHGVGLYLYEGEDTPSESATEKMDKKKLVAAKSEVTAAINAAIAMGSDKESLGKLVAKYAGSANISKIKTVEDCEKILQEIKKGK